MDPIIDPMFFYWIHAVVACKIVAALGFMVMIAIGFGIWIQLCPYTLFTIGDSAKRPKTSVAGIVGCFVLAIMLALTGLFIPSKDTLIQMKIAEHATGDNIQRVIELSGKLKEAIKQDALDIIDATKDTGK